MRGRVVSWTLLHVPPEGYEAPVRLCLVEVAPGRILLAATDGDVVSGDRVDVETRDGRVVARRA